MEVAVRLFGDFRRYLTESGGRATVTLEDGANVLVLLEQVGVPEGDVGFVSVNRALAPLETVLGNGDEVDVFSPLGGGSLTK